MPRFETRYRLSVLDGAGKETIPMDKRGPWLTREEAVEGVKVAMGWEDVVLSASWTMDAEHSVYNVYSTQEEHDADIGRDETTSPVIIQWNERVG